MQELQEIRVYYLSREDPLEKEMATHSSILCLENSIYNLRGCKKSGMTEHTRTYSILS